MNYATIAIDYDEFHSDTFRAVTLAAPEDVPRRMVGGGSNGALPELIAALDVCDGQGWKPMFASSVDHFISDLPEGEFKESMSRLRNGEWKPWLEVPA